tara:strand:+ start:283 stop:1299 length:1017 start_codon:yes stop_codon:yes gene_type:complete
MNIETIRVDSKNTKGEIEVLEYKIDTNSESFKADMNIALNNGLRNDDAFFLARQLNFAKQRITEPLYSDLHFLNNGLVSQDTSAPLGADSISYPTMDITGKAELESDDNDDFPLTEVIASEELAKFANYNAGYAFSMQDIRRSSLAGGAFNIMTRKVLAARRVIDENLDKVIRIGDARVGLQGFTNNPLVPNAAVTGAVWASKSAQERVDDISRAFDAMDSETKGKEIPDTLLLDNTSYRLLQPLNIDSQILSPRQVIEAELNITIKSVSQLKGTFLGASNGFILYKNDPLKVEVELPLRLETLPTVVAHGNSKTKVTSRVGSVKFYYPKSASYNYGI